MPDNGNSQSRYPPFQFPKSYLTLTPHMMLTFTSGASHTSVHRECQGEGILSDLSLVRIKLLADDLQKGGGELLDAPCSFALRYPSSLEAEFLQ